MLLGIMLLDAVGDAFRFRKWQIWHHIVEALREVLWFVVIAVYAYNAPIYLVTGLIEAFKDVALYGFMYFLGRIAFFDPTFNLVGGLPLKHIGNSSLYDRFLRRFTLWVKEPGFLIWVLRVMALIWWVAWFATSRGGN